MSRPFRMPDFLAGEEPPVLSSVLTSLVRLGADPERIEILPVGMFRAYRGRLVDVLPPPGTEIGEEDSIRLYVAERGIAERLPERFLVPLSTELIPDALFDAVPSRRIWRSGAESGTDAPDPEESYAKGLDGGRGLLRLLDRALRRGVRDLLLLPHRLSAGAMDREIAQWLVRKLGFESLPLEAPAERFLALHLPGVPGAIGTRGEAEALAKRLLRMPVTLSEDGPRPRVDLPRAFQAELGRSRLGCDTCIGETMIDTQGSLIARIGPLSTKEIEEILSEPEAIAKMRSILEAILPAWCEIRIELVRPVGEEAIVLGRRSGGLVGVNTRLSDQHTPPASEPPKPAFRPKPKSPAPVPPVQPSQEKPRDKGKSDRTEKSEPKRRRGRRIQIVD